MSSRRNYVNGSDAKRFVNPCPAAPRIAMKIVKTTSPKTHTCADLFGLNCADRQTHYGLLTIRLEVRDFGGMWVENPADY